MLQVMESSDSKLAYINHQLSLLKERMTQEQSRLNTMMEKKDRKIQSQNHLIKKMKNLIEMQKFQMTTGGCQIVHKQINFKMGEAKEPLPTIGDSSKLKVELNTDDDVYTEARSHTSSLKRQSKFIKGASRPKLFASKNISSNLQPSVSCQNLSKISHTNLSAASCENLFANPTHQLKPAVPSRRNVNQKLYNDMSDQDSGFWSVKSDNRGNDSNEARFKRRESYQRAISIESPSKESLLLKSKQETTRTIDENSNIDLKSHLTRFSSYSYLPNVC